MKLSPPHVPPRSNLVTRPPPITDTVLWLVVVYFFIVRWPSTAAECIFSFYFSSLEYPSKSTGNLSPSMFRHGRILSKISAPLLVLFSVGCCVGLARGGRSRPRPGPSLSLFRRPIHRPKAAGKSSSHAFRLGRVSSHCPPPRLSRPSAGCCVF